MADVNDTSNTPRTLQPGDSFEGKYEIVRELASGAFGTVYLAEQEGMDRYVAIKVLKPEMETRQQVKERFLREVRIISKLRHPNTVTIHDFGAPDDGSIYMVLEFIEGNTLKELLYKHNSLSPRRAANLFKQVLASLAEAHRHDVIHRDLKPANIMVTDLETQDDFVKVLDFGVARLRKGEEKDLTNVGLEEGERQLIGTPRYMSPEQVRGEDLSGASDLYSLGLMLYEVITGEKAVKGDTTMALITTQIDDKPLKLPLLDRIHPELRQIIHNLTAKNAKNRYSSAQKVAKKLDEFLQREDLEETTASKNLEAEKTTQRQSVGQTVSESDEGDDHPALQPTVIDGDDDSNDDEDEDDDLYELETRPPEPSSSEKPPTDALDIDESEPKSPPEVEEPEQKPEIRDQNKEAKAEGQDEHKKSEKQQNRQDEDDDLELDDGIEFQSTHEALDTLQSEETKAGERTGEDFDTEDAYGGILTNTKGWLGTIATTPFMLVLGIGAIVSSYLFFTLVATGVEDWFADMKLGWSVIFTLGIVLLAYYLAMAGKKGSTQTDLVERLSNMFLGIFGANIALCLAIAMVSPARTVQELDDTPNWFLTETLSEGIVGQVNKRFATTVALLIEKAFPGRQATSTIGVEESHEPLDEKQNKSKKSDAPSEKPAKKKQDEKTPDDEKDKDYGGEYERWE